VCAPIVDKSINHLCDKCIESVCAQGAPSAHTLCAARNECKQRVQTAVLFA